MECNKAAKNHCWLSHQTGGWENHGLTSAGRWWKRSCATTRLSHKGDWFKTFLCRSESIGLGKMGIFGFQVKSKTRFRMYMESLSADVKPFMDWAQLYFKCKKNNTRHSVRIYIDCFCLEILKASHLGIFNHQQAVSKMSRMTPNLSWIQDERFVG